MLWVLFLGSLSTSMATTDYILDNSTISVISLTDRTEEGGESLGAVLKDPGSALPPTFTYCLAINCPAFSPTISIGTLVHQNLSWFELQMYPYHNHLPNITVYAVKLCTNPGNDDCGDKNVLVLDEVTPMVFPFQWIRVCVGFDLSMGLLRVMVDGLLIADTHISSLQMGADRPKNLDGMLFGNWPLEAVGNRMIQFSQLEVFSSLLSVERMTRQTVGGSADCASPGDYLTWEATEWRLTGGARRGKIWADQPCAAQPKFQVYTLAGYHFEAARGVCDNIGGGRMVPVSTSEEFAVFSAFVDRFSYQKEEDNFFAIMRDFHVWMPLTDLANEGDWRDPYTGS